ncbi:hypothetical protein ABIE56_000234 [Luteibacter sp. 621]|uniref:hypothetical protein n=1 Tax=Luteibacter sp. 621 TaxID=3373916 RepID=UPI003D25B253
MRHQWIIVAASLVALTACTTKPPRPDQLRRPTDDRLLAFQAPSDGDASVTVTRDVGALMSACYIAVFVDGMPAAKLATGEAATLHVPAGEHIIGAWNTGSGLCGYREGKDRREQSTVLRPGDAKRYRVTVNQGSGIELSPTTM